MAANARTAQRGRDGAVLECDNHDVRWPEVHVLDPAGLDHQDAGGAVHRAHVPECKHGESGPEQCSQAPRTRPRWAQARREVPCMETTHADHFRGPLTVSRTRTQAQLGEEYERETGLAIIDRFVSGIDTRRYRPAFD
jgi:hypothetical protein